MSLSRPQDWNRDAATWLDISIAAVGALCAGVLAGVAFDGDHQLRFWIDAPHRINQIAGVLSTQLKAKLAAQFAGTEE